MTVLLRNDKVPAAAARGAVPAPPAPDAASQIAAALRHASAASALGFALAMHERMCERGEYARADQWLEVMRRLKAGR